MSDYLSTPCTAFAGTRKIASGSLVDVALAVRNTSPATQGPILTFDDASGSVIDLDLRGTTAEIVTRLRKQGEQRARGTDASSEASDAPPRAQGRPKLGVVAREVTLLPRHWAWLATQQGGASQALRRLVDEARRTDGGQTDRKAAQERAYRFLSAVAGDLQGFEEAIRALFAGEEQLFGDRMATWPPDIREHALILAQFAQQTKV